MDVQPQISLYTPGCVKKDRPFESRCDYMSNIDTEDIRVTSLYDRFFTERRGGVPRV